MYRLVCPTCRGEIDDSDNACPHCQQPLLPSASARVTRVGDEAAKGSPSAKIFWMVFALGAIMAMVLGFPEWFFAVKPETQHMGLMKMGYGTGAALLFGFIGMMVTRTHNIREE